MYCPRCDANHFAGSRCPACGGRMRRGDLRFSLFGEPLVQGDERDISPIPSEPSAGGREPGRSEGSVVRYRGKILESLFFCLLLSVSLRFGIFAAKVIDSLVQTGGEIRAGISIVVEFRRPVTGYEVLAWALITLLIFRYRHAPR